MGAKTERADCLFTVKEFGDGTPWIMLELQRSPGLRAIGDGFLGLDLKEGTDIREAEEIARYLNRVVETISHTDLTGVK